MVIAGSTILFLFGNGIFKRVSAANFPLSHSVGIGLCVGIAGLSPWLELAQMTMTTAIALVVVAVWEDRSLNSTAERPV